jgi:hypothetical protein
MSLFALQKQRAMPAHPRTALEISVVTKLEILAVHFDFEVFWGGLSLLMSGRPGECGEAGS